MPSIHINVLYFNHILLYLHYKYLLIALPLNDLIYEYYYLTKYYFHFNRNDLKNSYTNIVVHIDKVFNVYENYITDASEGVTDEEKYVLFANVLNALDDFKSVFSDG